MPAPVERLAQSPCGWCGTAITQPARGRRLRYCDRSCRQRAYELRTAQARHDRDVDAGVVRTEPAERVIERTVHRRHPDTAGGWATALAELARQIAAGTLPAHTHGQIRHALAQVRTALDATAPAPAVPAVPAPRPPLVDEPTTVSLHQLVAAGGPVSTTLGRLAAAIGADIDDVRQGLAVLHHTGRLHLTRHVPGTPDAQPVDPSTVPAHARFTAAVPT